MFTRNINGIPVRAQAASWRELFHAIGEQGADCFALSELNLNLGNEVTAVARAAFAHSFRGATLELSDSSIKFASDYKPGGTALGLVGHWSNKITASGTDAHGLGRWSYARVGQGSAPGVVFISCYRPCSSPGRAASTVHSQHWSMLRQAGRAEEPRTAFFCDMLELMSSFPDDNFVICGDMNGSLSDDDELLEFVAAGGLVDAFRTCHPEADTFATYNRGHRRIDYIFVSAGLGNFITHAGYTSFGLEPASDHRACFADLDLEAFLGTTPPEVTSTNRLLRSTRPADVLSYRKILHEKMAQADIFNRMDELLKLPRIDWTDEHQQEAEFIDSDIIKYSLQSEAALRCFPPLPWSPTLAKAVRLFRFWQLHERSKRNGYTATAQLERLAFKIGTPLPTTRVPSSTVFIELASARQALRACNKNAADLRTLFMQNRASAIALHDGKHVVSVMNGLKGGASIKALYSTIARKVGRPRNGATRKILVPTNTEEYPYIPSEVEGWKEINDPKLVEEKLVVRNQVHFSQAQGTPWTVGELASIPFSGTGTIANQILKGDYGSPSSTRACDLLIKEMRQKVSEFDATLTLEDVTKALQSWCETTSTSPSGRHLGHLRALSAPDGHDPTSDDSTADAGKRILHCITGLLNIAVGTGRPLKRWRKVTNTMIEKEFGKPFLHRFRVIHIYENDYNLLLKVIIARRLLKHAEDHDLIHEAQGGSRKGRSSIDIVLKKHLAFSIARRSLSNLAMLENDASACYDRIVPSQCNVILRAHGLPETVARLHGETLQNMTFHVRTSLGESEASYSHTPESPVFGTGQGSCASPVAWCLISSLLFQIYHRHAHGARFCSPNGTREIHLGMTGFVDDTSILLGDFGQQKSAEDMLDQLRKEAELWDSLLHASGGKLEVGKCSFSYAFWARDERGIPRMDQVDNPSISIRSTATGQQEEIRFIPPEGAHKTLGVMLSASRNCAAELARIKKLVVKHAETLRGSGFQHYQADTYARRIAGPAIAYGLACSTFPKRALDDLQKPLIAAHLTSTGFPSSFPRALAHAPRSMLGLGIPTLHVTQGSTSTLKMLRHIRLGTELGRQILIDVDWAQLEAGTSYGIFTSDRASLPHLNLGWTTCIRDYLAFCKMSLSIHSLRLPKLRRGDDSIIMDEALRVLSAHRIRAVNRCRLHLQVETVTDICDLGGNRVMEWAWNCLRPIDHWEKSSIHWPRQPRPDAADLRIWRAFLTDNFCSVDRRLYHPLGPWIAGHDNDRTPRAGTDGTSLLIRDNFTTRVFLPVRRGRQVTYWKVVEGPAPQGWIQPVHLRWHSSAEACTASPIATLPTTEGNLTWEAALSGGTTLNLNAELNPTNRILAVSDGGVKEGRGYYGFTVRQNSTILAEGKGPAWGSATKMDSLRAETFGMLALSLALRKLKAGGTIQSQPIAIYTDSKSCIDRLDSLNRPGPPYMNNATRPHADVLLQLHHSLGLFDHLPPQHVSGHADRHKDLCDLTEEEQMNVRADTLATQAGETMQKPLEAGPIFPAAIFSLRGPGGPMEKNVVTHLQEFPTLEPFRLHCRTHFGWTAQTFNSVSWPALSKASKSLRHSDARRITRHAFSWLPVGTRINKYDNRESPICPRCSNEIETCTHVCSCPGLYESGAQFVWPETLRFISLKTTSRPIRDLIWRRLMSLPYPETYRSDPFLASVDEAQSDIGWNHFYRGFITPKLEEANTRLLDGPADPDARWSSNLIQALWKDFASIWMGRNKIKHPSTDGSEPTVTHAILDRLRLVADSVPAAYPNESNISFNVISQLPAIQILNALAVLEPLIHPSHIPPD